MAQSTQDTQYQAYVEAVLSLNGALATANTAFARTQTAIKRKVQEEQGKLRTQLCEFDSKVRSCEEAYAKSVDALEQTRNQGLTVSLPRKVRPIDSVEDADKLLTRQRELLCDVTVGINSFKHARQRELDAQKAQAAIKVLEAKRAAEALAARRAVLANKPQPEQEPEKKSPTALIVAGGAAIVVVLAILLFVL
nr:hypothetical protein [Bifidobacterium dentium]